MEARSRWLLPAVAALHAGLLLALARSDGRPPQALPMAMSVALLTPPAVTPPRPAVVPRPQPPRPVTQPVRSVSQPAPATAEPAPLPAARPETAAPAPAVTASTAPPAPAPVAPAPAATPPRFDAAYLNNPAPPYPPLARRMGEQGRVLLRVLVSAGGAAEQVELKQGSGSPRLDQAALEAVRRWRFVPAQQGRDAVAAWVLVPISFNLES